MSFAACREARRLDRLYASLLRKRAKRSIRARLLPFWWPTLFLAEIGALGAEWAATRMRVFPDHASYLMMLYVAVAVCTAACGGFDARFDRFLALRAPSAKALLLCRWIYRVPIYLLLVLPICAHVLLLPSDAAPRLLLGGALLFPFACAGLGGYLQLLNARGWTPVQLLLLAAALPTLLTVPMLVMLANSFVRISPVTADIALFHAGAVAVAFPALLFRALPESGTVVSPDLYQESSRSPVYVAAHRGSLLPLSHPGRSLFRAALFQARARYRGLGCYRLAAVLLVPVLAAYLVAVANDLDGMLLFPCVISPLALDLTGTRSEGARSQRGTRLYLLGVDSRDYVDTWWRGYLLADVSPSLLAAVVTASFLGWKLPQLTAVHILILAFLGFGLLDTFFDRLRVRSARARPSPT